MNSIFESLGIPVDYVIFGMLAVEVLLFILYIVAICKNGRMKKRLNKFMEGKNARSLEEAFEKKFENMDELNTSVKDIYFRLKMIDEDLLVSFQKVGIVKYDAFKEIGGKLSYVLVLLSKDNSGVMLNCMHSNHEGCYTYVKRIVHGKCKVTLSKEEEFALLQAMGQKSLEEEIDED